MYELNLTDRAYSELERLPTPQGERLLAGLERLALWPDHGGNVRKLSGPFKGLWRLRVGDYRALFNVDDTKRTILVTRIGPRQRIYS